MLVDRATIHVKAGEGGAGSASFRREKFVPRGGPDGGDGGRGGHVYLVVSPHLNSLLPFKFKHSFKAERGEPGAKRQKHGRDGADLFLKVPPGTIVRPLDEPEAVLADLTEMGERFLLARGGRGGRGNVHFATSTHQTPRMAERGEPGQESSVLLELKLIADVGLVGYPNAGKSSLLRATTAAQPKVAPYPFTTLSPYLGVAVIDERTVVIADIPGLIEGAAAGVGLGHEFLRHIERTRLLVHVLDGADETRNPLQDFDKINHELELHSPRLAEKPQIVAFNKIDVELARERFGAVKEALSGRGYEVLGVSAVTGEGVQELLRAISNALQQMPVEEHVPVQEVPVLRPRSVEENFEITREGQGWRVSGPDVERLAAMTDTNNWEALQRLEKILTRTGVITALRDAGAEPGDEVRIGNSELVWSDWDTVQKPEPERPRRRRGKR